MHMQVESMKKYYDIDDKNFAIGKLLDVSLEKYELNIFRYFLFCIPLGIRTKLLGKSSHVCVVDLHFIIMVWLLDSYTKKIYLSV